MFEKSAYDLWKIERMTKPIITLCKEFDNAIGGGVHIGAITEFVGGPGTGKTQLWYDNESETHLRIIMIMKILFDF